MEYQVTLASQDITDDIIRIGTIARSTDYPFVTETQPSTAEIVVSDTDGDFSPENVNNFFARNSQNRDGTRCPVRVLVDGEVLFAGETLDVNHNTPQATVQIKCHDLSRQIRTEELTDFGLAKAWKLIEDTEQGADGGVYPIGLGTAPISDESATVSKALNADLEIVPEIKTTGVLDRDNVQITDRAVRSEGENIDSVAGGAYPQISAKSPYRYKDAATLVNAILEHYNIAQADRYIELPAKTVGRYAESLGRPGYESVVGKIGSSQHLNWLGHVTDMLLDGDDLYFAYSPPYRAVQNYSPRVFRLNLATDTWTTFFPTPTAGTEIWGLAKIGDNLILLTTEDGHYDSAETGNETQLLYFDVTLSPLSLGILVGTGATLPAQIATFYASGSQSVFQGSYNLLPDTRRRLIVHNSELYYPYASSSGDFGVAKVAIGGSATAVVPAKDDGWNRAGFAYAFDGSDIVFGTTFLSASGSTRKIVRTT